MIAVPTGEIFLSAGSDTKTHNTKSCSWQGPREHPTVSQYSEPINEVAWFTLAAA